VDDLLTAIRDVSERDDTATRTALYVALLDATLLLPSEPDAGGEHLFTTPPGADGAWKLLAFTDPAAAARWRAGGVELLERSARDVFAAAVTSPTSAILLNVAGPAGGELTRREFSALAEGVMPSGDGDGDGVEEVQLEPGSQVFVTAPARPPGEAFLGVLRMALDESDAVRAAWLADVAFEAGEVHPAVGVAVDPETGADALRAVFDLVMARIQPLLGHGRYLDFIVIDEAWGPLFAGTGSPVFDRGRA
jgi:hypothetical protein